MNKCLNNKRLILERSKLFFYLSFAVFAFAGVLGKDYGLIEEILKGEIKHTGAMIFFGVIIFFGLILVNIGSSLYAKQDD